MDLNIQLCLESESVKSTFEWYVEVINLASWNLFCLPVKLSEEDQFDAYSCISLSEERDYTGKVLKKFYEIMFSNLKLKK